MTAGIDTNIIVYIFGLDAKATVAQRLLETSPKLAVQSLNEFALVARRRLLMTWPEVHAALGALTAYCPDPHPLTAEVHVTGLRLAERYQLRIYDAMIVAAALTAGCATLWSEDMHDGLVIDDRLTIRNPFA